MKTTLIILFFITIGYNSIAHSRIAIVNSADTNLYYEYVATTFFGNSEKSIPCDFNVATFAEERIISVLEKKFEVERIKMPPKLHQYMGGPAIKKWVKSLIGKYEKVIILSSAAIYDVEHSTNAILIGSGLYSRMGIRTDIYSTIYFHIYNTYDGNYAINECQNFKKIQGYTYSETKNEFNPEMINLVISEVKRFINEKIQCSLEPLNLYTKNELIAILNYGSFKQTPGIELAYEQNISDSMLVTGWYYTTDQGKGFKRKLDKSEETFFIDPKPIATKDNFRSVDIYQTDFKGTRPDIAGLNTILDDFGRTAFAYATYKSYDRHVVLVINNKLVSALLVKSVLNDGNPFLQRKEYNLSDIQAFAKEISDSVL